LHDLRMRLLGLVRSCAETTLPKFLKYDMLDIDIEFIYLSI
jgi:hypothetical protein